MKVDASRSVEHHTFAIEGTYSASADRVYAAWSSLDSKMQWFGGDGEHTLDFRVGGREHRSGRIAEGPNYAVDAVFLDIVDQQRIVWVYEMAMDGERTSASVATLELTDADGGTRLVLTEQGAFLDGLDSNSRRRTGTEQILNDLSRYLDA